MSRKPEDCASMDAVRAEIDRIDTAVITLLSERWAYVNRAADFKASAEEVSVPWRNVEVIAKVRTEAEAKGLPADLAETLWRNIISTAIHHEKTKLDGS